MSITTWAVRKDGRPELGKTCFILVSGKIGAGKTTFSRYLSDTLTSYGYVTIEKSFADALKEAATFYFNWDGRKEDNGRKLLQGLGNLGREYDEDLWANTLVNDVREIGVLDFVIVDDWRFQNELNVIRNNTQFDLITVRIFRDNAAIKNSKELLDDVSETSLSESPDDYDFDIYNLGSMEDLQKMVNQFTETILEVK